MWNFFNCYLSGRHDYGMWCEPGQIFLRCIHCGKRSPGWAIEPSPSRPTPRATVVARPAPARLVPFKRAAAS